MSSFNKSIQKGIDKNKVAVFHCDCGEELLVVTQDKEWPDNIEMAVWLRGRSYTLTWKDRIRYCWQIIRYGRPYNDQIILSRYKARKFAEQLFELTAENEEPQNQ